MLVIKNRLDFDHELRSPEFLDNPYPLYHRLRAEAPVYWSDVWNCWLITRYDDALAIFRDKEDFLVSGRFDTIFDALPPDVRQEVQPLENHFSHGLLSSDPPNHTRLRKLVQMAFTPRIVAQMQDNIQTLVDRLLDTVQAKGQMDVIQDLAYPLPVIVLAGMLGVPAKESDQFKEWSDDIMAFQDSGRALPDTVRRSQRGLLAMRQYLSGIFAERLKNPQDDLISGLVLAEAEGDKLTYEEMLGTSVTMMVAGHETTTHLIGNGLLALLQNPEQMQQLGQNPSLIEGAVEEFLRYESPLQRARRMAARDIEFQGVQFKKGQLIMPSIGAANRDPAQFPNPDQLDIQRQPNRHIAFGFGIHFCLGAPLARLEAPIALNTILRRFPNLHLNTAKLEWHHQPSVLRGLKSLPVRF